MDDYEHTQPGTLTRVLIGIMIGIMCLVAASIAQAEDDLKILIVAVLPAVVLVVLLVLFHSLTVRVSADEVAIAFGIGLIKKSFRVADIQSCSAARTHWYNGWGIRGIRRGWLYNVSGFDAVELQHTNGKRYQIGTDEPEELLAAIQSVLTGAN